MGNVQKKDLVKTIANRTGLQQVDAQIAIECFFKTVSDYLIAGRNIELRGFGRFKIKEKKARLGRNPWTGEKLIIPHHKKPILDYSKFIKWDLNKPHQNQTERVL